MFSFPPFYFAVGRRVEALFSFGLVGALTPRPFNARRLVRLVHTHPSRKSSRRMESPG